MREICRVAIDVGNLWSDEWIDYVPADQRAIVLS